MTLIDEFTRESHDPGGPSYQQLALKALTAVLCAADYSVYT